MNILQKIAQILHSILSRVHLVRSKDTLTITVRSSRTQLGESKTKNTVHTRDSTSEKGVTYDSKSTEER